MEFNEKLQELRKQKSLTQDELAQLLFVSRAAVSKWESGRGYPSIDSLKALSAFYGISIDDLLSGGEALTLAQEEHKQKESRQRDIVFGLLDCSMLLLLFLPLYAQRTEGVIREVSLMQFTGIAPYMKAAYFTCILSIVLTGMLTLALKGGCFAYWDRIKTRVSLILSALGVFLFIISPQPYTAAFLFIFLAIKVCLLAKKR